ncbi:MAG: hypothetical protein LBG63_04520 [Candidatus Methanoplasma sp.]|jgi:hypothetical protein|nr:hypothetical protein [Candidatus Methanoplasma sp.]
MNKKGMVDFPMWLAVTLLILAIFVPVAIGMVNDLKDDTAVLAAKAEADKIENMVKGAYYSGAGSADTVSVSLSGGSCLVIGGDGSDSYCISILIDDTVFEKMYLQRPSVRFLGDPVYIMGNNRTVSAECVIENGVYGVRVSVID